MKKKLLSKKLHQFISLSVKHTVTVVIPQSSFQYISEHHHLYEGLSPFLRKHVFNTEMPFPGFIQIRIKVSIFYNCYLPCQIHSVLSLQ